jgi:hypothetical protein
MYNVETGVVEFYEETVIINDTEQQLSSKEALVS